MARYTLTDTEHTESSEYLIVDDQIGGKGITYDLSSTTAKPLVSLMGQVRDFALPEPFEKALSITVEFDGPNLTARGKDRLIDYWQKFS